MHLFSKSPYYIYCLVACDDYIYIVAITELSHLAALRTHLPYLAEWQNVIHSFNPITKLCTVSTCQARQPQNISVIFMIFKVTLLKWLTFHVNLHSSIPKP